MDMSFISTVTLARRIPAMGLGIVPANLNPILDEANPLSTCSLGSATAFREVFGVKFTSERARGNHSRGWFHRLLNAAQILCSWTITVQNLYQQAFSSTFALFGDVASPNIGLDLRRNPIRDCVLDNSTISFVSDGRHYTFLVHIRGNGLLNVQAHIVLLGFSTRSCGFMVTYPAATDALQLLQNAYIGLLIPQLQIWSVF